MHSEIHIKGQKVPASKSLRERKGLGAKGLGSEWPGRERARAQKCQGANWPGSNWPIRSRERRSTGTRLRSLA